MAPVLLFPQCCRLAPKLTTVSSIVSQSVQLRCASFTSAQRSALINQLSLLAKRHNDAHFPAATSKHLNNIHYSSQRCLHTSSNGITCSTVNGHHNPFRRQRRAIHNSISSGGTKAINVNATGKQLTDTSPAPSSAEVVVIGGGAMGCSALYHLAKMGVTDTVLVEGNKLTAGTTWHSAGLIWRLRPSDTDIQLLARTRAVITGLEEETGVNPGWINNGVLYIASSKMRLDEYKRAMTMGRVMGIESHALSPEETKKMYPLMNVDDIYGTLYCPGSGTVEPGPYCDALIRVPKNAGARVMENCPVTGITTKKTLFGGRKVTQVKTSRGPINTNCIINTSGVWANNVAKFAGLSVPLVAIKHAYLVTETIPGIKNMPNIRDHDLSVYLRLQGDALSIGGYEQNPRFTPKMTLDFAFGLYEMDYEVFEPLMRGHIQRVPVLAQTGIKSTVCGPESFTPDHKPIMGEDHDVSGFFHCCGFNSGGMMLSGGCGEQIAHWAIHGRPQLDMSRFDVKRFHAPLARDPEWVKERSHEAFAKHYSIPSPHTEPLAGRGRRKSPLHEVLEAAGCVYQERHGWERPGWYNDEPTPVQKYDWFGSYNNERNKDQRYATALSHDRTFGASAVHEKIKTESLCCRTAVVGFDMSYCGKFYLSGPDARVAADHLFSADMRQPGGATVYTCMLNQKGGIESDLTVSVLESGHGSVCDPKFKGHGYYLTVGGAFALQNHTHVIKELRKHNWDVAFDDHTDDMALLSVQGPLSRDLLQSLTDADLSNEAFPFSSHQMIEVAGHNVRAIRVSSVGEMGWELHIPNKSAVAVYKAVVKCGKSYGYADAGYRAMDSLSCEKGYRQWQADIRPDDTPLEAGLEFTCKLETDIQFLGRNALEKQKSEGIRKTMVTLELNDPNKSIWGVEGIKKDGQYVGFVRRGGFGFDLKKNLAYGYVSQPDHGVVTEDFLSSGEWSIESMGENYSVQLHKTHPFDPSNERIKGIY